VSRGKNTLLFLVSYGVTVLLATVAGAICVGTFCGIVFASTAKSYSEALRDVQIAGIVTLVVAIVLLVPIVKLIKWRWRRDINQP
jgi:hypothetical protein